jgi:hypothetical protein
MGQCIEIEKEEISMELIGRNASQSSPPLSNLLCDDGLNNVDGIRQTDMLADWYIIGIGKRRP